MNKKTDRDWGIEPQVGKDHLGIDDYTTRTLVEC